MTRSVPVLATPVSSLAQARRLPDLKQKSMAIMVVMALMTGGIWSFAVPIFESPDEPHHWQYARYLHDEWRLPLFGPNFIEANSPPLYYLLLAPLAADSELPPQATWEGADGNLVLPFAPRFYLNAADDFSRYWPLRASRLLTAVFMAIAVWYVFRAGLELGSYTAAVLAAAFVTFLPQFAFRGSTISNDSLVATCAAGVTFHLMRAMRGKLNVRDGLWTGFWLAGAYLSKINAICLVGGVACAALIGGTPIQQRVKWGVIAIATALAIALPWSVRNVVLYGDPFASGAMHEAVKTLIVINPLTSPYFYTIFPFALTRSFVGVMGWMNLWLPETLYRLFGVIALVGLVGVISRIIRRREDRGAVLVLVVVALGAFAVVVHINRTFHQPQGRYLFPALPALGLLWGLGVDGLIGHLRRSLFLAWAIAGLLAFLNAVVVLRYVIPAYYPAVVPTLARSVERLPQVDFTFGLQSVPDGWLQVTNADPQLAFNTAVRAEDFGFLQFEIEGVASKSLVPGTVFFLADRELGQSTFQWRSDGHRRTIIVPLVKNPVWQGRITTVRIDPFDPPESADIGRRIRISAVQLRGTP